MEGIEPRGASVDDGASLFRGASGKWAGEQMLKALAQNRPLNADVLRTLDTLRYDEWKYFDDALVSEAVLQLKGVADLISNGLTRTVPNSMGKTVYAYEKTTFMDEAQVSMDPAARTDNDRVEFDLAQLPLPVTHKDFYINIRTLAASRTSGEGLDTVQIRAAGRVVAEKTEQMLFQGLTKKFGGLSIYGYTTYPDRNIVSFGSNGNWATTNLSKTGANMLDDVLTMIAAAQSARFYGPYFLYVGRDASVKLDNDFNPPYASMTIRQRLGTVDGIRSIGVSDYMPAASAVLVQATSDVVSMVLGEPLQTIQWDVDGGMRIQFKAFQIAVPLIKSDIRGRCGIVHMS